jgi:hypothetical protein
LFVEARDAAEPSVIISPITKNCLLQYVNHDKIEKPWCSPITIVSVPFLVILQAWWHEIQFMKSIVM